MPARRLRSLSGRVQLFPVFKDLRLSCVISEGFKSSSHPFQAFEHCAHKSDIEYWQDLSQSNAFDGQILIDCIQRLHDDVLKVWNFHDPGKVSRCFLFKVVAMIMELIHALDPIRNQIFY